MPYRIKKVKGGYKVSNKETGKTYSKKPMSKAKAKKQMAAMYVNMNESEFQSEHGDYVIRVNGWVGIVTEHAEDDKIYYTYAIVNPNGEYEEVSQELDKHFGGAFRPNFSNIKKYLERKSMKEDRFAKDLDMILESIDEQDPFHTPERSFDKVDDVMIEEYNDPSLNKMLGLRPESLLLIHFDLGSDILKAEPRTYDNPGHEAEAIDWEVIKIRQVKSERGVIKLNAESEKLVKDSLMRNYLNKNEVFELLFAYDEPDYDDGYEEGFRRRY